MRASALVLLVFLGGCESIQNTDDLAIRVDVICEGPCGVIFDGKREKSHNQLKVEGK